MSMLERLLRGLERAGVESTEVRVELRSDAEIPGDLPRDLMSRTPLCWSRNDETLVRRIAYALRDAGDEPVLCLAADTVVDGRLLEQVSRLRGSRAFVGGSGRRRGAVLRLERKLPEEAEGPSDLSALAERVLAIGAVKELSKSEFDSYITNLRRDLPAWVFRVRDEQDRDFVERFLFRANYKGSTDFLTRWVYPPLVWRVLRPLARNRVHPNWVTTATWLSTLLSIPCFAAGWWGSGLALAYLMSVLDSVDGKLARLTFSYSRFGDVFDHGLDLIHPPFWYLAWGWALGGGVATSPEYRAAIWMFGFYAVDRMCASVFKRRTGRSIHGITPLDERFRTVISRRNVNLAVLTLALGVDWAVPGHGVASAAFYAIVGWQVVCLVFHATRVVQYWNHRPA